MTKDDLIEVLLLGMYEGTIDNPIPIEYMGLERRQVDKLLEACLTDKI